MLKVKEKWNEKYPNSMERWEKNWDVISPIFKFTEDVRKVIYTTNAIESLNSSYRRLNRQRSVFPHPTALLKALYLSTHEATKNGLYRSGIGARYMASYPSCMETECRNEAISENSRHVKGKMHDRSLCRGRP